MGDRRVALVTGSTAGIGLGIARELQRRNHTVALVGRDRGRGLDAEQLLGGPPHQFFAADASDEADTRALVPRVVERYGRLDVVVVNAGGARRHAPVESITSADWEHTLAVNLSQCFWLVQESLPHLNPGARIVLISSVVGRQGRIGMAAYAAAKHGMVGFARSLALELGSRAITVNVVCPGLVLTDALDRSVGPGRRYAAVEDLLDAYTRSAALGRAVTVDEVAAMVGFLAGRTAAGITGAILPVDGGMNVS